MGFASELYQQLVHLEPLSVEETHPLVDAWKLRKSLKRNDFLIQKGQTEKQLYFVIEGCMRIYFPHQSEEICVGFAYENTLICSYPSFIKGAPSDYFIQALKKTKVIGISRSDFYRIIEQAPKLERAWRKLTEEALLGKIQREVEMLTFSPKERYERLLDRSPHLFQKIPLKYIASYLGMSPETLSRIRK